MAQRRTNKGTPAKRKKAAAKKAVKKAAPAATEAAELGLRAYSRHRAALGLPGRTLSTVQRAIESGRIPTVKRGKRVLIPVAEADAAWRANTEHQLGKHGDDAGEAPGGDGKQEGPKPGSAAWLKAQETKLNIERKRLELEERRGALVDREAVQSEFFAIARRGRDRLLNVAARIAAQVTAAAQDGNEREVEQLIAAEIRQALEEESAAAYALLEEADGPSN